MQRPDDTAEALVTRLEAYHGETVPILGHYASVATKVEANAAQSKVWTSILEAL
jgi:adenylate kinase